MPETDVETPAESSPAEEPQAPEKQQETVSVPTNAEDYAEWRLSGKLPEKKEPSPETSAPSKKPSVTAAPEPASQNKRQGFDSRKEELSREIRELIAQRDRIKSEVQQPQPVKEDVKPQPESSPAQPAHEPLGRKRPKEPNQDDFSSWADYKKAESEYTERLAEYKAAQIVEEYVQSQEQRSRQAAMQQKLDDAKQRYGDEAEPLIHKTGTSLFQNQQVHQGVKAAIGRSDVMVDALYVMGSDPAELESFVHLATKDPLEALRKWFTVETLVKAELGRNGNKPEPNGNNTPMRDEDGKFVSAKPPAKLRHAPAPATELGGSTSPPGDERDRAAASGDVRRFFSEGNRRDLARWKGQS